VLEVINLWFYIDFHSHVPIYQQIKDNIKSLILRGTFKPGEFIPSIRSLAHDIGVNLNTVARAYKELETEGVIRAERGEGYVVVGVDVENLKKQALEELRKAVVKCVKLGISIEELKNQIEEVFKDGAQG